MIIDKYNEFSDAQAVTASAASTNVVDLLAAGDAENRLMRAQVQVDTAATASGSATVAFVLQTSVDEAFTSPITLASSAAIGKATLVAGYQVFGKGGIRLPSGCKRYVRMYYTVASGPLTAGAFSAFLTNDADSNLPD